MLDQSLPERRRRRKWTSETAEQFAFATTAELIGFVSAQIRESGRTYKDIASKSDCCLSTVSRMAAGDTRFPRLNTVMEILRTLGFALVVRR